MNICVTITYFLLHLHELVADPQSLLEEKEALEEKLAIRDYENRLAQEDILKFKNELQKKSEARLDESAGKYFIYLLFTIDLLALFLFYLSAKYLYVQ